MKRMITALLLGVFFCTNIHAMSFLQKPFVYMGQALENINLPIVGKLNNILPCAMISSGLQQCPGQSMLVLAGLLVYVLSQNGKVRELLAQYGVGRLPGKQSSQQEFDETLFIFDGDDADDAEEQMDTEDELLEFSETEEDDMFRKEKNKHKRVLKFL